MVELQELFPAAFLMQCSERKSLSREADKAADIICSMPRFEI